MLRINSSVRASRDRQKKYASRSRSAEDILEPQFGTSVRLRIFEAMKASGEPSITKRKVGIRLVEDPKRIIAWAIAQRIREAREKQGLTQEDLAVMVGIARPNIARLEKGIHTPTLSTLKKVANALRLDINIIMSEPEVNKEDRRYFKELAESGLDEWIGHLGENT